MDDQSSRTREVCQGGTKRSGSAVVMPPARDDSEEKYEAPGPSGVYFLTFSLSGPVTSLTARLATASDDSGIRAHVGRCSVSRKPTACGRRRPRSRESC